MISGSSPRTVRSPTMGKIPFCPSNVRELRLNMQVSVTRSSGRNSRGIIRWIGTLPCHDGHFIGVELESESKLFLICFILPFSSLFSFHLIYNLLCPFCL